MRRALILVGMALIVGTGCRDEPAPAPEQEEKVAESGNPNKIELETTAALEPGKLVAEQSGCTACHKFGSVGGTLGPDLTEIGAKLPASAIARSLEVGPGIMPDYNGLRDDGSGKFDDLVLYVASLNGTEPTESEEAIEAEGTEAAEDAAAGGAYIVTARFEAATQLKVGAEVRIGRETVGTVGRLQRVGRETAATLEIDEEFAPIAPGSEAILRQKTLLGKTYVELTPPGS